MISPLILRHVQSYKNRLLRTRSKIPGAGRESLVLILGTLLMWGIYSGTRTSLLQLGDKYNMVHIICFGVLELVVLMFFFLLLLSSSISAISAFYSARDTPLLLAIPLSRVELFLARFVETYFSSSWMFFLFCFPALYGIEEALHLPRGFTLVAALLLMIFAIIPTALGCILATTLVNVLPPHRVKDLLGVFAFLAVCSVLYFGHDPKSSSAIDDHSIQQMMSTLAVLNQPDFLWLPPAWVTGELGVFFGVPSDTPVLLFTILICTAAASMCVAYLFHDLWFVRGWALLQIGRRIHRSYGSKKLRALSCLLFPLDSQFRALLGKEFKMFVRDTTQSLQLLFLMLLTMIYLYNFRALRNVTAMGNEGLAWWQAVLSSANVVLGACVISAVCARFVFPSVSLEGSTFALLRMAPMSVEQFLWKKFFIWLGPIMALSLVLLTSGSWAILSSYETIMATVLMAVAQSIGLVGLGIGVGSVYARFDWDSPHQVISSFGSLVYMLLSLATVGISIIPGSYIFILSCVHGFAQHLSTMQYTISLLGSLAAVLFVNIWTARRALAAGAQALEQMEQSSM